MFFTASAIIPGYRRLISRSIFSPHYSPYICYQSRNVLAYYFSRRTNWAIILFPECGKQKYRKTTLHYLGCVCSEKNRTYGLVHFCDGSGDQIQIFGYLELLSEKWIKGKLNEVFLHFLPYIKYLAYFVMIFGRNTYMNVIFFASQTRL